MEQHQRDHRRHFYHMIHTDYNNKQQQDIAVHHKSQQQQEEEEEEEEKLKRKQEQEDAEEDAQGSNTMMKKGPWTAAEDQLLMAYVEKYGEGNWNSVQKLSGVWRCGKSCRLRWSNHLKPGLKKGSLTPEEERVIITQHAALGNRWARIATMVTGSHSI